MSKQPQIKIVYPNATTAAMLLTDAMIKRASGKRVVTTDSEEREYTGEALFGALLACKTDTSVELTLNLNPDAMDYALTTLIAKNLTEDEKRQVRMETDSMEIVDLLSTAQAAAGAGTCTEEVGSAERASSGTATQIEEAEAKIEISEKALRDIINEMFDTMEKGLGTFDAVNHAIWKIKELVTENHAEQIKPTGAPGEDYSDIERVILNCLNDHLPDADYLTKTGIMHDMTRRLKLNIQLRTKQHKAGLLSSVELRMILHDMVDALGGSYAPGVVVSHIDAAVEEIDRECRSVEIEDYEATNAITAQLGLAICYILSLNDSKKDKRIHALFILGQKIKELYGHDVNINSFDIERAADKADEMFDETPPSSADPIDMLNEIRKYLEDDDSFIGNVIVSSGTPPQEDVEEETKKIGKNKADKTDKTDEANEANPEAAELKFGEETESGEG